MTPSAPQTRERGSFNGQPAAGWSALEDSSFKRETLQGAKHWLAAHQSGLDTFRWVTRYNARRKHSHLAHSGVE